MGFSVNAEVAKLPLSRRDEVTRRIDLVHAAQRRLGMDPRDDSMLTFNYANGILDDDESLLPSTVANELYIVDRIHKSTNYGRIIEDVMREIADHVRNKYRLSWADTWDIVRFYVPTMLKLYCARSSTYSSANAINPSVVRSP